MQQRQQQLRSRLRLHRGDLHKTQPVTGAPLQPEAGLPEAIPTSAVTLAVGSTQTIGPLLSYKGLNVYVVVIRDNEGKVTASAEWRPTGSNPNVSDEADEAAENVS